MKRIFALTFVALLLLSLAACGGSPATTPTAGEIEASASTESSADLNEIIFDEFSVYESDMCSIVVTSINAEAPQGYTLNLSIANNTEAEEIVNIEYIYETNDEGESEIVEEIENIETIPTTLEFVLVSAKINGTEVEAKFSSDVESGMRNYDQIVFDSALKDTLGDFTEIELSFRVYNIDNPDVDVANATATIYPYGDPNAALEAE